MTEIKWQKRKKYNWSKCQSLRGLKLHSFTWGNLTLMETDMWRKCLFCHNRVLLNCCTVNMQILQWWTMRTGRRLVKRQLHHLVISRRQGYKIIDQEKITRLCSKLKKFYMTKKLSKKLCLNKQLYGPYMKEKNVGTSKFLQQNHRLIVDLNMGKEAELETTDASVVVWSMNKATTILIVVLKNHIFIDYQEDYKIQVT